MRVRIHVPRRLAFALACIAMYAPAVAAQDEPADPPRAFCWAGRPAESCRAFLVAELSGSLLVGGTRYTRREYDGSRAGRRHLVGYGAWEVGVMRNVGPRDAVGATLLAGGDANGARIALKGRYRRWMSRGAARDVGAGLMIARRAEPHADPGRPGNAHVVAAGLTGEAAAGLTDWALLSVRGDLLFDQDGTPAAGLYGGLKLGPRPGLVATILPPLAMALFVLVARPNP